MVRCHSGANFSETHKSYDVYSTLPPGLQSYTTIKTFILCLLSLVARPDRKQTRLKNFDFLLDVYNKTGVPQEHIFQDVYGANQLVLYVERLSHCLNITLWHVHLDGLPHTTSLSTCLCRLQGCRGVCPKTEDHQNRATAS